MASTSVCMSLLLATHIPYPTAGDVLAHDQRGWVYKSKLHQLHCRDCGRPLCLQTLELISLQLGLVAPPVLCHITCICTVISQFLYSPDCMSTLQSHDCMCTLQSHDCMCTLQSHDCMCTLQSHDCSVGTAKVSYTIGFIQDSIVPIL